MFPINKGQLALNVPGHVSKRSLSYASLKKCSYFSKYILTFLEGNQESVKNQNLLSPHDHYS